MVIKGVDENIDNPFSPTVDHVKPMRSGGKLRLENLVASCWRCRIGKKGYDESEVLRQLPVVTSALPCAGSQCGVLYRLYS
jgi:5-methylcytosine-specific restriction endonuclease McrA